MWSILWAIVKVKKKMGGVAQSSLETCRSIGKMRHAYMEITGEWGVK